MQQRAEAAEGVLERERGLHRRELRRRAKELADMQEDLVQVGCEQPSAVCNAVYILSKRTVNRIPFFTFSSCQSESGHQSGTGVVLVCYVRFI